jgi:hypothetical protein
MRRFNQKFKKNKLKKILPEYVESVLFNKNIVLLGTKPQIDKTVKHEFSLFDLLCTVNKNEYELLLKAVANESFYNKMLFTKHFVRPNQIKGIFIKNTENVAWEELYKNVKINIGNTDEYPCFLCKTLTHTNVTDSLHCAVTRLGNPDYFVWIRISIMKLHAILAVYPVLRNSSSFENYFKYKI